MTETTPTNDGAATPDLTEGAVRGHSELRAAAVTLVRVARREVRLRAPHLDPAIFNTAALADTLSAFATQHARNRVRIFIEDVNQVLRDNNRLIVLARRLGDAMELREVEENERGARDLYLIADRAACLIQEDAYRTDGVVSRNARETTVLAERFDRAWDQGLPIALQTLGLR